MNAWHVIGIDKRLRFDHDEIVAPGWIYSVQGQIEPCTWGMHASVNPIDALFYGIYAKRRREILICRVKLGGEIIERHDKVVAQSREVLWMVDPVPPLKDFVRSLGGKLTRMKATKEPIELLHMAIDLIHGESIDQAHKAFEEQKFDYDRFMEEKVKIKDSLIERLETLFDEAERLS